MPHRQIRGPLDAAAHREPYPTPEEAREAYERIIAAIRSRRCAAQCEIQLLLDGAPVDERLVVRTLPRVV